MERLHSNWNKFVLVLKKHGKKIGGLSLLSLYWLENFLNFSWSEDFSIYIPEVIAFLICWYLQFLSFSLSRYNVRNDGQKDMKVQCWKSILLVFCILKLPDVILSLIRKWSYVFVKLSKIQRMTRFFRL